MCALLLSIFIAAPALFCLSWLESCQWLKQFSIYSLYRVLPSVLGCRWYRGKVFAGIEKAAL